MKSNIPFDNRTLEELIKSCEGQLNDVDAIIKSMRMKLILMEKFKELVTNPQTLNQ